MYTNIPLSKNWYNGHHKKQTIAIYSKSKQKKPCVRLKKYLYIYSRSLKKMKAFKIFLYSQACLGQLTVDVTYLCSYGLLGDWLTVNKFSFRSNCRHWLPKSNFDDR